MRTALHSVSYSGSWGQAGLSLAETIERIGALGFDGVMLAAKRPHASLLDMGPEARRRLRATMDAAGVGLECLAAYTNFTADAEHAEVPHREMQVRYVEDLCRLAVDLGGRVVRVFTGYEHPALPFSRAWDLTVAAVKECARRAADVGAVIAVQNHHDLGAGAAAFLQFLRAVDEPACLAAFDAWAPALQGDDLPAAARSLAPLTVHTTVADYARLPRYRYQPDLVNYVREADLIQAVPVGDGFIDYRGFLTALTDHGFGGCVAYEMCSPLRDGGDLDTLDRYARRFLEFVKPWTDRPRGAGGGR
ncbi:MAG: sugar phosphate isomerase/epimerase [Planctomycetia bacterium]|nr:sugar phosphate isomerase/epimerase [Planctomycetia bacterium]